jgi:hypothetical protein
VGGHGGHGAFGITGKKDVENPAMLSLCLRFPAGLLQTLPADVSKGCVNGFAECHKQRIMRCTCDGNVKLRIVFCRLIAIAGLLKELESLRDFKEILVRAYNFPMLYPSDDMLSMPMMSSPASTRSSTIQTLWVLSRTSWQSTSSSKSVSHSAQTSVQGTGRQSIASNLPSRNAFFDTSLIAKHHMTLNQIT